MTSTQKCTIVVSLLANFVAPFMTSAMNLSINDISTYFSCGAGLSTWIVNAYTLSTAVFSITLGSLADIKGQRRLILVGSTAFAVFTLAGMLATSAEMLLIARLLMGIAAGAFIGAGTPLMLRVVPAAHQGRYVGLAGAAVSVGIAIGPVIGGAMNSAFGWRSVFVPSLIISIATVLLSWRGVDPDPQHTDSTPVDFAGNLILIVALSLFMLGLGNLSSLSLAPVMMVAGAVLLVAFGAYELRLENPAVQVRLLLENHTYTLSNLCTLASFISTYAITYVMAIHLQNIYSLDSATAGLIMMSQPIIQALLSPYSGKLCERFDSCRIAGIGMLIVAAGLLVLSAVSVELPLAAVIAALLLSGFGMALFASPNMYSVLDCVGQENKSQANATASTMRGTGQCISLAAVGLIYSFTIGNQVFSQTDIVQLAAADAIIMKVSLGAAVLSALFSLLAGHLNQRSNRSPKTQK